MKDKGKKRLKEGIVVWVVGSTKWKKKNIIKSHLEKLKKLNINFVVMGVGGGAEQYALQACRKLELDVVLVPANNTKWEDNAVWFRNDWILRFFKPTHLLAFHQDIENSRSTAQCIRLAKKKELDFKLVTK